VRVLSRAGFLWNSGEAEEKIYGKYKYFVHHGTFCGILWL
jgi:hypothetical protein